MYPIWRLILEGNQLLSEVEKWDLVDIYTMNGLLDMKNDVTNASTEASRERIK